MDLSRFPRRQYTKHPTPIEHMPILSRALGGDVNLWVKRDDMLGLTGGGNKTRKLEFVMADAIEQGADTIITCGAVQSNHCRLTLSACIKEGLRCCLVVEERVIGSYNTEATGNNYLVRMEWTLLSLTASVPWLTFPVVSSFRRRKDRQSRFGRSTGHGRANG